MSISEEIQRIEDAKEALKIAINNKGGSLTNELIDKYAEAVAELDAGGEGSRVRFIDYDGTILKEESLGRPTPPDDPVHEGLRFLTWNYIGYGATTNSLDVGATYITESGACEFDVMMRPATGYTVTFCPVINSGTLTIDWGDGSTPTEITSTQNISFSYADYGTYTVKFSISEGGEWYPNQYFAGGSSNGNYWLIGARLYGITNIYQRAFNYCYALRECVICAGVTTIGNYAFEYCRHLIAIVLPASVTSVGTYCFEYCYSLKRAVWNATCTSISNYTFRNCEALDAFAPPDGLITLGEYCFYNCYALQLLRIPESVTEIGRYFCQNCYSLTGSIVIPDSVESMGTYVFNGCYSIEKFTWRSPYNTIPERTCYNAYNLKSVNILEGTETIGSNAFYNCYTLQSVELPDSVTTINSSAFNNCYSLTKLTLGTGVTSIGDSAFGNSYPLEELELPDGLITISNNAFQNCHPLREVTFPETLESIGNYAFQNCYGLRDIHCKRTEPPTLGGGDVFSNISKDCTIWVPKSENREVLTAYKTASYWSTYADYMVEEEDEEEPEP